MSSTVGKGSQVNEALSPFTYWILPGSLPDSLEMLGDESDMERGVLHIVAPAQDHPAAQHSYLPVQAIPQGMAKPDLVAEVFDGPVHLTTLHFCTLWRVRLNEEDLQIFERVSFPEPHLAMLYNRQERLEVCPSCHRLHRRACVLTGTKSLEQALILTGLALRVHEGYVYLVSGELATSLGDMQFRGRAYWYAITGLHGLQACYGFSPKFSKLDQCSRFLAERKVPPHEGWLAVTEPLVFAPYLRHWLRSVHNDQDTR